MSASDREAPFVEACQLVREYRVGSAVVRALAGLDLAVGRGEFLAVLGVSGSGKSTLLHLLGGLDRPTAGSVRVEGCDLATLSPRERTLYRRRVVGFVFQSYYLVPSLTAEENVALALTFQGIYGAQRKRLAAEALERVGLAPRARHRPGQLSGGEQQRVAIARAGGTPAAQRRAWQAAHGRNHALRPSGCATRSPRQARQARFPIASCVRATRRVSRSRWPTSPRRWHAPIAPHA
ncbi:MAG: ABC transporter ATP-binding protein [Thermoguttaceae bacterium]|nr:ABC transporter ATP-binding protein [Thermoguttaceae bacterium]